MKERKKIRNKEKEREKERKKDKEKGKLNEMYKSVSNPNSSNKI